MQLCWCPNLGKRWWTNAEVYFVELDNGLASVDNEWTKYRDSDGNHWWANARMCLYFFAHTKQDDVLEL